MQDTRTPTPDHAMFFAFARALTGVEAPTLTFQTFAEREGSWGAGVLHGTPADCFDALARANAAGAGVFFCVNEIDGTKEQRRAENIVALRALFADDDADCVDPGTVQPPPSLVVSTSPGKRHVYWLLKPDEALADFTPAQKAIAAKLGTDPAVCDLSRVLRVPGFLHQKPGKDPTLVTFEIVDVGRRYSIPEVLNGMGATLATHQPPQALLSAEAAIGTGVACGVDLAQVARAKEYIARIRSDQGNRGDVAAYKAAAALVRDFALPAPVALDALREWNQTNAMPPWSEQELEQKIAHAQRYGRHAQGAAYANDGARLDVSASDATARFALTTLDAVEEQEQIFLWPGFLPDGALSLIEGDPDVGKSFMALDLAARLSTGRALPDGDMDDAQPRRKVLFLTAEDSLSKTVKPRLLGCGADLANISSFAPSGDDLLLPRALGALRAMIRHHGFKLVVLDALNNFLDADAVNVNREQEVRQALKPLRDLAAEENVAIIGLRHLNKKVNVSALYRGAGTIALAAVARSVLLVARHPDDPGLRIVIPQKANLVADGLKAPIGFRIVESVGADDRARPRLAWEREVAPINADELLAVPRNKPGPRPHVAARAELFLRDQLARGPRSRKAIMENAKNENLNEKAVERAATTLGVVRDPSGQERLWALPSEAPAGRATAA
jgi:archaellum biogenesis ATPase FlaH